MFTVLSVIGTRPEAIKMAPVVKELARHGDEIHSVVCVTGQHRQMLDQVIQLFDIKPQFDLNLMQPNQMLSDLTASLFSRLGEVIREVQPRWILAQGDTTTVLVTALLAYYERISYGHVEAGLRTGDLYRPFPEELNRRIADTTAMVLFAPTQGAYHALRAEGYADERIVVTGNTVVDALIDIASRSYDWASGPLRSLPNDRKLVVITAHRRESFGDPFRDLCSAIRDLALRFQADGFHFVYPVHLNPNVRRPVSEILTGLDNVSLIEPLDYLSLVHLMKRAVLILTDSGGIQEEAPSFKVPVLVMRDTTERPEGIQAGVARLVGTSRDRIFAEASRLLSDPREMTSMRMSVNPYGDGKAAEKIVSRLIEQEKRDGSTADLNSLANVQRLTVS